MFFKDFVNGLSEPFKLSSVMDGAPVTLPAFNQALPYLLHHAHLRPGRASQAPFSASLTAYPLTSRASVVTLQAEQTELQFAGNPPSAVADNAEWFLLRLDDVTEFCTPQERITLQEGDLAFLNSQSRVRLRPHRRLGCKIISLKQARVVQWQSLFSQVADRCFYADNSWGRVLSVYLREMDESFMERIAEVTIDQAVCLETILSLAIMMFGQRLAQERANHVSDRKRLARHRLYSEITIWLYANYARHDLSGSLVASQFGVSVRSLHKLFSEFNGETSFAAFLNRIRMQNARKMLRDSSMRDLKIGDIGWHCGFADPAHFGKAFRKFHSLTPRQMRERALIGVQTATKNQAPNTPNPAPRT